MKQKTLSEKVKCTKHSLPKTCDWVYTEEDLKEAVKMLKELFLELETVLCTCSRGESNHEDLYPYILYRNKIASTIEIDKIFGEKLT